MAELAACYGELERTEGEENDQLMYENGDYTDDWDDENDYRSPNDGRCSPEIPLVDKPPRRLPVKSFYRSTTAQVGTSSKTALPKDIIHDKSRKTRDIDMSNVDGLIDGRRSKASTLGQTPSRQQKASRKSKAGSSSRQVQYYIMHREIIFHKFVWICACVGGVCVVLCGGNACVCVRERERDTANFRLGA